MKNEFIIPKMGPRFSIYRLTPATVVPGLRLPGPDRHYVAGRDTLDEAILLARSAAGKVHIEIWDNKIQRQCYINEFGKERFARGYEQTHSPAIAPRL